MDIRAECCFYPIGQGLFYTMQLRYKGKPISVVYDCGTLSPREKLRQSISEFRSLLPTEKGTKRKVLDLLVLSHLHADHINGLPSLLKNVRVKTVVLPYLCVTERYLSMLALDEEDYSLLEFYAQPVEWLINRFGVERILVMGYPPGAPRDSLSEKSNESEERFVYGNEETIDINGTHAGNPPEIRYISYEQAIRIQDKHIWDFVVFMPKQGKISTEECEDAIEELRKHVASQGLSKTFADKSFISKIKARCGDILTQNESSVLLAHYPDNPSSSWFFPFHVNLCDTYYCHHCFDWLDYEQFNATLLTGDTQIDSLKEWQKVKNQMFPNHDLYVISVPHHGGTPVTAKWKSALEPFNAVVSYGLSNSYGHPNIETLKNASPGDWPFRTRINFVNERHDFSYTLFINT
ncbi:MAG: MBL fold metallo-hydrolase [Oscillospiraceae bacterium]|nr:MBL fold metallo-hydrolase [Oscillospiraceae bacterium]